MVRLPSLGHHHHGGHSKARQQRRRQVRFRIFRLYHACNGGHISRKLVAELDADSMEIANKVAIALGLLSYHVERA
jgi:hypothetical protein